MFYWTNTFRLRSKFWKILLLLCCSLPLKVSVGKPNIRYDVLPDIRLTTWSFIYSIGQLLEHVTLSLVNRQVIALEYIVAKPLLGNWIFRNNVEKFKLRLFKFIFLSLVSLAIWQSVFIFFLTNQTGNIIILEKISCV